LTHCSSVGFARSRQQVIQLVQEVVTLKGLAVTVTHGWWESFRRRHPKLTLHTAAPVSYARAMASDPEIINNYYDLLECTLCDNDQEFQEGVQTARKPGIPPTAVVSFSPEEITRFQF